MTSNNAIISGHGSRESGKFRNPWFLFLCIRLIFFVAAANKKHLSNCRRCFTQPYEGEGLPTPLGAFFFQNHISPTFWNLMSPSARCWLYVHLEEFFTVLEDFRMALKICGKMTICRQNIDDESDELLKNKFIRVCGVCLPRKIPENLRLFLLTGATCFLLAWIVFDGLGTD